LYFLMISLATVGDFSLTYCKALLVDKNG
jgi:hypothetical protein